ncbi:MAG: GNAT family N-acetyltransferase [Rhodothermales bacterium]|nr:GNAT family N-acetyltransferase [Rhodothermales bacterium]
MHIRPATIADVELIRDFIVRLARYEKLEHEAVVTIENLENTLFGEQPFANVLIAEHDSEPAGFALYFHNYSTFLGKAGIYLEDLFVIDEKRGLGIGRKLLQKLAQICVENDFGRLEWSVLDWNEPAIKVYERLGARSMKEWITYRIAGSALQEMAAD